MLIIIYLLFVLPLALVILGENHCCPIKEVFDGNITMVYDFKEERPPGNPKCMNDCVYTKDGEDYCFSSEPTYPVRCMEGYLQGNKCGKKTCEIAGEGNKNELPSDCLTGTMISEGCTRHIKFCNNSATFIGEKNHELWWDKVNKYWFCGIGIRDGIKELNENGITMPFNLSSAVNNFYYKTECPRKAIFSKDEYKVRMEYACLNTTQHSLPYACLNNTDYSNPHRKIDYIMIIIEGKNDPMDLAPRGHGLNWDEYKYGYNVNMEIDIYENITGYHLNDTLWKAHFPPPVGAITSGGNM